MLIKTFDDEDYSRLLGLVEMRLDTDNCEDEVNWLESIKAKIVTWQSAFQADPRAAIFPPEEPNFTYDEVAMLNDLVQHEMEVWVRAAEEEEVVAIMPLWRKTIYAHSSVLLSRAPGTQTETNMGGSATAIETKHPG